MLSLNTRLLFAGSVVLAGFLGLTGFTLDKAFRDSAEAAMRDRLQGDIYALLAAAELNKEGVMTVTEQLPEKRFSVPGSGIYGQIASHDGKQVLRSPSMADLEIPFTLGLAMSTSRFERLTASDGTPLYALSFGLSWKVKGKPRGFTFSVAENRRSLEVQVHSFRRSLWGWLGGVAVLLLVVQGSILRWGLAPLRRAAADLGAIEAGQATQLQGRYPKELRGLTDNLNALITSGQGQLERYRHTLGDLAHSLKTPLAVVRGAVEKEGSVEELRRTVQEQIDRMTQIVEYQLQRAAASGRTALSAPIPVADVAQRIAASLNKVYADKGVSCHIQANADAVFHGDESDLMEFLGNLMDNAYKWCRGQVAVTARSLTDTFHRRPGLELMVEDNGPGISPENVDLVLQRGARADETISGHGIGLAVVRDILRVYDGVLEVGKSELGGASLKVRLPGV
ncbi:MAG: ATP-binding protein [Pseudomonadota bacterium]